MYGSQSQTANGWTRFRSAPSSFLESLVSGTGDEFHPPPVPENLIGRFFSGDSSCLTSESSCQVAVSATPDLEEIGPSRSDARPPQPPPPTSSADNTKKTQGFGVAGFRESEIAFPSGGSNGGGAGGDRFQHLGHVGVSDFNTSGNYRSPLTRHSSSPAGFFTNLHLENGYSLGGSIGCFSLDSSSSGQQHRMAQRRLKSQLSFSRRDSPKSLFSQVSDISSMAEVGDSIAANSSSDDSLGRGANGNKSYMSTGFPLGSWDESHPVVFGGEPKKRNGDLNSDHIMHGLTDSQFELSNSSLEMTSMEKFMQMQQDSVP